jgi:hypothetical protein
VEPRLPAQSFLGKGRHLAVALLLHAEDDLKRARWFSTVLMDSLRAVPLQLTIITFNLTRPVDSCFLFFFVWQREPNSRTFDLNADECLIRT